MADGDDKQDSAASVDFRVPYAFRRGDAKDLRFNPEEALDGVEYICFSCRKPVISAAVPDLSSTFVMCGTREDNAARSLGCMRRRSWH